VDTASRIGPGRAAAAAGAAAFTVATEKFLIFKNDGSTSHWFDDSRLPFLTHSAVSVSGGAAAAVISHAMASVLVNVTVVASVTVIHHSILIIRGNNHNDVLTGLHIPLRDISALPKSFVVTAVVKVFVVAWTAVFVMAVMVVVMIVFVIASHVFLI